MQATHELNTLPCSVTGSGDGSAAGTATTAQYTVTITYYDEANATLACRPTVVPAYATLRSVASISANGQVLRRTLTAKYEFQVTVPKPAGGRIHLGPVGSVPDRCLNAASGAVNTPVTLQVCSTSTRQIWAYHQILTISLVSTHAGRRCAWTPPPCRTRWANRSS